jgi:hypothetical protein
MLHAIAVFVLAVGAGALGSCAGAGGFARGLAGFFCVGLAFAGCCGALFSAAAASKQRVKRRCPIP